MITLLFLFLLALSQASQQLQVKINAAFDALTVARMRVLGSVQDGGLSLQIAHQLVVIVKIRLILSSIPQRLYHSKAEELHWLMDDAILGSQALEPKLSQMQTDFMALKCRLHRVQMWTTMMLHTNVYDNVTEYRVLCLRPLLEVKLALGNMVGWSSTAISPADEHDFGVATLVSTVFLTMFANLPETTVTRIEEMQQFLIPNLMNDLLHHRPTMAPEIVAKIMVDLIEGCVLNLDPSRLHPTIAQLLERAQEDVAAKLLASDRPKQKKRQQQAKKMCLSLPSKSPARLLHARPDEADSDDEEVTTTPKVVPEPIQVDPSWQPSPIWRLYAKVFKAQHCRIYLLIPLRMRLQSADPNFHFSSWNDLPQARQFEEQLGSLDRAEVLKCIQITTERNIFMHNGSLLKYLHNPTEIVTLTGLPLKMVSQLLQYNWVTTEAMAQGTVDFASQHLSEKNARRSIVILALYFLVQELDLQGEYNQIRMMRRGVAHPPVLRHDPNLNLIKEYLQ